MAGATIQDVLLASLLMIVFTGLGALPFIFIKSVNPRLPGLASALAAGLMLGASIGLMGEGLDQGPLRLILGLLIGFVAVMWLETKIDDDDDDLPLQISSVARGNTGRLLLIVVIMTAHSFAEGIALGVSFGHGVAFGAMIALALAIHKLPEGLAISLVLVPRGVPVLRAAAWCMFSSLPLMLMAIPAFLLVQVLQPILPVGLGMAAGAMMWMVFNELLPDALLHIQHRSAWSMMLLATCVMLSFQAVIGV